MSTSKIDPSQRNVTAGVKTSVPVAPREAPRPTDPVVKTEGTQGKAPAARRDAFDGAAGLAAAAVGARTTSPGEALSRAARTLAPAAVAAGPVREPGKRTVTLVYDAGPHSKLTNLQVKGSWDAGGKYSADWSGGAVAMKPLGDGRWSVTLDINDDGQPHDWQWGVSADGPGGKGQWALMGEANLKLDVTKPTSTYAPTTYHKMGSRRSGEDAAFTLYAGNARGVTVKVTDPQGRVEHLPMTKDEEGNWSVTAKGRWKDLVGKSYVYEVEDSAGLKSERPDPYAREMMGEQRGVDRMFLDPKTGQEVNRYAPGAKELMRFDVDGAEGADRAYLVLRDEAGKTLGRDELLARLGEFDTGLVDKLRAGGTNDFWSKNIEADGRIRMTNEGGAWTTLVNNPAKLEGLRYELQVFNKDAQGQLKLRDDTDGDGKLSDTERLKSNVNDPWSNLLTKGSGVTFRGSVVTDPTSFQFKNDEAPREKDKSKWVVYQAHPGSFLGQAGNSNRSTLEDMMAKLDYFKKLGVNTLELLPVNEVEGSRNWGYLGVNSLATESSLGFEDESGKWVSGPEAMKRFIDEAHKKGLNVISDVVYNHVFGDYNGLWDMGGEDNPYFNWSQDKGGKEELRETPWGSVPAYSNPKVKQFFVDHAVSQLEELHFDGLRFDFTEPIKGTGGKDGWDMLREINRQVHFFNPNAWTVAEQFDYDPALTKPAQADGKGGGGFDAQWYTEFQHRLVHDNNSSQPGIIQAAARGMKTDMDAFVSMMTNPRGIDGWKSALSIISNHDEVGNAERTMNTAEGANQTAFPDQWARGAARFAAGMGMAGPGIPMFFQGDEFGAQNDFRWGNPSTWDSGWSWESLGKDWNWDKVTFNDARKKDYERLFNVSAEMRTKDAGYQGLSTDDRKVFDTLVAMPASQRTNAMLDITKRQSFQFYRDAIALRQSSPAFSATAEVNRVYTHNDNSVMAFTRKAGGEEYLVVGSMNRNNLEGYSLPLPPGNWKEVLNSDAATYGGGNFGNNGSTVTSGNSKLNIPAAGYVVLKRV